MAKIFYMSGQYEPTLENFYKHGTDITEAVEMGKHTEEPQYNFAQTPKKYNFTQTPKRTDTRKWFEIPSPATAFPLTEEELVRTIKRLVELDIDPPESRTICNAVAVLCAVREGLEARYA